ncbi:MAG TPA: TM2 domain-containing protein [Micromonosporaceae bacterium]
MSTDPTRPDYSQSGNFEPPVGPGYPPPGAYPPPMAPGYAGMPYTPVYAVDAWGRPLSDKSKVIAGILQILLGGFGVGRFYIGDNKTAVLQLVVTLVTCGLGHIWGIIDGILILVNGGVDAQGRVLRD